MKTWPLRLVEVNRCNLLEITGQVTRNNWTGHHIYWPSPDHYIHVTMRIKSKAKQTEINSCKGNNNELTEFRESGTQKTGMGHWTQ